MSATESEVPGKNAESTELPELRQILNVPEAAMDHAMGFAYQLYVGGHHAQVVQLCQALIACDRRYWWPHSLLAASLRRLERYDEALQAVKRGLEYEAMQPKLLLMRSELQIIIARRNTAARAEARERTAALESAVGAPTLRLAASV
jgi:hypothetical protein